MDLWDGLIIGVGSAVIGAIIVNKFLQPRPTGGGNPVNPAYGPTEQFGRMADVLVVPNYSTPSNAAPLQQTNPNVEAAFNQGPVVAYEPAFNTNYPTEIAILPQ